MKEQNVTDKQIEIIRKIFADHRTSISDVLLGIKEAKAYLFDSNIEKSGLYKFAVQTMESKVDQSFPEENMLACQIYSELDSQLMGKLLIETDS